MTPPGTDPSPPRPRRVFLGIIAFFVGGITVGVTGAEHDEYGLFDPLWLAEAVGFGLLAWGINELFVRGFPWADKDE